MIAIGQWYRITTNATHEKDCKMDWHDRHHGGKGNTVIKETNQRVIVMVP